VLVRIIDSKHKKVKNNKNKNDDKAVAHGPRLVSNRSQPQGCADNGTISPVIQSTNQSRIPSSRPRADVRPKGKDTKSNPEHKVERKC